MITFVDSSVWIDFFAGRDSDIRGRLRNLLEDQAEIVVGDIIYVEVLRGFRRDQDVIRAREALDRFRTIETLNRDLAIEAAEMYRHLRRQGITIRKTVDLLIGACCLKNRLHLLHNDRDFDPMEQHLGLNVLH